MGLWTRYLKPNTVENALDLLANTDEPLALIAGGTDLLLDLRQGRHPPVHTLVDISEVAEMGQISQQDGMILLGAAVPLSRIIHHPLIRAHAACLVEACGLIGGPQVRNVATLGGNVAHALPAGDGAIALLALDAQAEVAGREGARWMDLIDLYAGPGQTTFDRTKEILVRFRFKERDNGENSAFRRVMRPQGVAIAIQNMGVWLRQSANQAVADLRLALGPAGPVPFRARRTERVLIGASVSEIPFRLAAETLRAESQLRTSRHRATKAYREHLLEILLERTVRAALTGSSDLDVD